MCAAFFSYNITNVDRRLKADKIELENLSKEIKLTLEKVNKFSETVNSLKISPDEKLKLVQSSTFEEIRDIYNQKNKDLGDSTSDKIKIVININFLTRFFCILAIISFLLSTIFNILNILKNPWKIYYLFS